MQQEGGHLPARKGALTRTHHTGTPISAFPSFRTMRNKWLFFKSPSLWYFVIAGQADLDAMFSWGVKWLIWHGDEELHLHKRSKNDYFINVVRIKWGYVCKCSKQYQHIVNVYWVVVQQMLLRNVTHVDIRVLNHHGIWGCEGTFGKVKKKNINE